MQPSVLGEYSTRVLYECPSCNQRFYRPHVCQVRKCDCCGQQYSYGKKKVSKTDYVYVEYKGKKIRRYKAVLLESNVVIPKGYGVHHIDFNRYNDDISNLFICIWSIHRRFHCTKTRPNASNWSDFVVC